MVRRTLAMAMAALLLVCASGVLLRAAGDGPPTKATMERDLKDLLKMRAGTAKDALEAMQAAYDAETVVFDQLADAAHKLAEAEVAAATTPAEEIAALQQNVERTRQLENRLKMLFEVGARGGEAKEYYTAKRDRESAEIWLLQSRLKAKP